MNITNFLPRSIRPGGSRGRFLAAVVGLLTPALLVALPAGAAHPAPDPAPERVAAAAPLTEDHSLRMLRTRHNEVTGDFLNWGYDQRAVVENGHLNIYDRPESGGALIRSTPTDLYEPTTDRDFDHIFPGQQDLAKANGLGAIALAWTPDGFFMAGLFKDGDTFYGSLYKLPADGSCAQLSCSEWGSPLPTTTTEQGQTEPGLVNTSALAAGTIGTRPVLALGLTTANEGFRDGVGQMPGGIYLVDANNGLVISTYQDGFPTFPVPTVVTALDWDDNGSGLLAVGAMSDDPHKNLHAVRVSADGTFSNGTNWEDPLFASPVPLAVAVGHRTDGSPVAAYGMSDGGVKLWDPALTSTTLLAQFTGSGDAGAVDALTFTDRIDGTDGVPDLVAVSNRGNSARVLRFSGATTLTPLAVAPKGGTSTDVGGIRAWFPGYKTGTIEFQNATGEDPGTQGDQIQLDFATRANAAYGCWFSLGPLAGVAHPPPALPTTSVIVDQFDSRTFTTATLTAGEGGDCAATDFTGQWAAYVVVTPLSRPADRTVAKLVWSRSGELTVQSVGGSLTLDVEPFREDLPLREWTISIESPPPPATPSSIKVTGKRLDPAGTARPVYRFDVAATTWPLPASTPRRIQTVLPPLQVHGTTSTGDNVDLGLLVPQGQPSRSTSGSVTLSPVSFYWQNPATGQQITDVWVDVGTGSRSSNVVDIPSLAAPPAGTTVGQLAVCPATGSSTGSCGADADPVANGLDQAPLRIQVYDGNAQVLPVTDPVYGQIYYRDEDGDLLTGLVPADGSAYVRVSPYAGAYPNDGSTTPVRPPVNAPVGGRFGYLSTTSTNEQEITAHVGGSPVASAPTIVDAVTFAPEVQQGAQAGSGFYVNGCSDDYRGTNFCRLAQSTTTQPGLFLTTDPDTSELLLGLQFANTALTSLTSLPLQQVAGQAEHTVAANPLIINNGEVHLNTTSGFQPADAIDTWLVTHGTQLPVQAVHVGGGN